MQAGDIWGLGVMLFYMIFGEFPFESPTEELLDEKAFEALTMVLHFSVAKLS